MLDRRAILEVGKSLRWWLVVRIPDKLFLARVAACDKVKEQWANNAAF